MSIVDYLYEQFPFYERQGKSAYKSGLDNTYAIDAYLGHPHKAYKTVHVAGTNGKGSCSSMIASVLQQHGYKTGLYASPHLLEFGERIKINGVMIADDYIVDFVRKHADFLKSLDPSFFEVVTAMAFQYFKDQGVDVAIVEVGLGGRLDCTNIIAPELSVITNISQDHSDLLGKTLPLIAAEKAGILKAGTLVVVGESQDDTNGVFEARAQAVGAELFFADRIVRCDDMGITAGKRCFAISGGWLDGRGVPVDLLGKYQAKNVVTVLFSLEKLRKVFSLQEDLVVEGLSNTVENTGLAGRWQQVNHKPDVICDTAHNEAGVRLLMNHVNTLDYRNKYIVWGMVSDKDASSIIPLLPRDAKYFITKPSVERGLSVEKLEEYFIKEGLSFEKCADIGEVFDKIKNKCESNDLIIITGSTFLVSDALKNIKKICQPLALN